MIDFIENEGHWIVLGLVLLIVLLVGTVTAFVDACLKDRTRDASKFRAKEKQDE